MNHRVMQSDYYNYLSTKVIFLSNHQERLCWTPWVLHTWGGSVVFSDSNITSSSKLKFLLETNENHRFYQ